MKILSNKNIAVITATFILLSAFSCASTEKTMEVPQESQIIEEEPQVIIIEDIPEQLSEDEIYFQKIENLKLKLISYPNDTTKKKEFSEAYKIQITNLEEQNSIQEAVEIRIKYPKSKENAIIKYDELTVKTNSDGTLDFLPEIPEIAVDDFITFTFDCPSQIKNEKIEKLLQEKTISAPYKVKTDYLSKGGAISLVDYSANGKVVTNNSLSSSALLTALMKKGYRGVGNADFTSEITGDRSTIYPHAKKLFHNSSSFLIYGTVKFSQAPEKKENLFYGAIIAEITCINMENSSIMLTCTKEYSDSAPQEAGLISKLRTQMAEDLAQRLYYSM